MRCVHASGRQGGPPAREKEHASEASWADGYGLSANGTVRRYDHPVLFPGAEKHREPDHPLQEYCRKDRLHRIPGDEAGLYGRCRRRYRSDRRRHFTAVVWPPDPLGLDAGLRDVVWMGTTVIDCVPADPHPQNCDPAEHARHQARSRAIACRYRRRFHLIEIESGTPLASVQSMVPLELPENSPL